MSRLRDCHCLNLLFLCFLNLLFPLDTCFLPFRLFLDPSFLALLLWAATDGSTILMTQNIIIFFLDFKNIFRFASPPWFVSLVIRRKLCPVKFPIRADVLPAAGHHVAWTRDTCGVVATRA